MGDYKLSASLSGHEDDVRAVSFTSTNNIASASRDATVRHWSLTSSSPPTYDDTVALTGQSFINSLAFASPSPSHPDGLIFSAGKDTIIDVRPPGRPPDSDAERLLLGHQGNVCALDVDPEFEKSSMLVSGSWDASAIIWNVEKGEAAATLEGHEGAVWAVLVYDRKIVITGCADHVIRVWSSAGKLLRSIKGTTDVVRALCRMPKDGPAAFASAGNDAVIRLWTLEGQELYQLHGHENFIYSIAALPGGDLASSSEDRTVRIWRGRECVQTVTHPAISVWSVAVNAENGDLVTGASDRIVRVFSKDPKRHADEATLKAFNDAVQGSSIPQQQMPEINKEKLPGPDFLQQKSGTKEGQVQMIREDNGNVTAHQWSAAQSTWINVGTVVDSQGSSGRKQAYLGQDYDYVFDVDIAEGQPPLKLPFNLSQNPYEVAQKFIADNELPITYLDQVANFIITNSQGAAIGQDAPASNGPDPWGTQNRYRPEDQSATQPTPSQPRPKILPQKDYLYITTASYTPMFRKIAELNTRILSDPATRKLGFSDSDLAFLPTLTKELQSALSNEQAPVPTSSENLTKAVTLAEHIITNWPPADRIPGLDMYRVLAAATPEICGSNNDRDVLGTLHRSSALASSENKTATANTTMLALRTLGNLFAHAPGRQLLASNAKDVLAIVSSYLTPLSAPSKTGIEDSVRGNRNVHIAATTLCINYAVLFSQPPQSSDNSATTRNQQASSILSTLTAFIADHKVSDSETLYRALVAMGTLMAEERLGVLKGGDSELTKRRVGEALSKVEKGAREPRLKAVVGECRALLA